MITTLVIAVAALVVALVVVLSLRDRGRDRSARDVPHCGDVDRASSTGIAGYHHEQGGPGA